MKFVTLFMSIKYRWAGSNPVVLSSEEWKYCWIHRRLELKDEEKQQKKFRDKIAPFKKLFQLVIFEQNSEGNFKN